ncbi:hypothetical protein [Paenibacillus wynnii]|uniref:Uncharacterized protein n=1 Tax=Paenibacillus wynnii TaxID=268407 RepID=A0A098M773_9BACL|nr:hypothetical protein [Paenibacillus wynnii]KGE18414.1 hypothetical protein PWYN_28335 [Paenibacillus wynnii]
MQWLQGGPLFEVSLITKEVDINSLISEISKHKDIDIIEENIELKINEYKSGYLFDENNLDSQHIHSININIYFEVLSKRKALLFINQVAEETLLLDFCFYGSEFDAPEWGQKGIQAEEYHHFVTLLSDLMNYFNGIAGSVAIEEDVLGLISEIQTWPDKVYSYKKINPTELMKQIDQEKNYIALGIKNEERIQIIYFE